MYIESFQLANTREETACSYCGEPITQGDRLHYYTDDAGGYEDEAYCSRECAKTDRPKRLRS